MKKTRILMSLSFALCLSGCDVQNPSRFGDILKQVTLGGTPTSLEMGQGIKQALEIGTSLGADRLSSKDGFLGNAALKILFPEEARKVESTLRGLGLNSLCDQVITSLNRAAEDATKEAKPIFLSAIKQMTISDATAILFGEQDAATNYFKRVTTAQLMEKFNPIIASSLRKVGATNYWGDAIGQYNRIPLVKKINPDLSDYVARKAVEGLFIEIAQEELKIRGNLTARSTPLLQKVFGYADSKK